MPKRPATSPPSFRSSLYKSHFSEKDYTAKDPAQMAKIYEKTLMKLKKGSELKQEYSCISCCTGKGSNSKVCSCCKRPTCLNCLVNCEMCDVVSLCGNCSISTHQILCLDCAHNLMVRLVTRRDFRLPREIQSVCLHTPSAVDVRLRCKDHKGPDGLGAHRLLLASASPHFLKNLLLSHEENHENDMVCIHLPDYNAEEVFSVISLLYYGELMFHDIVMLEVCQQILRDLGICVTVNYDFEDNLYKLVSSSHTSNVEKASLSLGSTRTVKRELEAYECNLCDFITYDHNAFTHHTSFCPRVCPEVKLESHSLYSNEENNVDKTIPVVSVDTFHCSDSGCQYSSKSLSDYQVHLMIHNRQETNRTCPICCMLFNSTSKLKQHLLSEHSNNNHGCCECDWIPANNESDNESLVQHIMTYHTTRPSKLECEYCEYSTSSSSHLSRHLKVHNNEKAFECPHCSAKFRVRHQLQLHRDSVHSKKHEYKCDSCPGTFATHRQLKIHTKLNNCGTYICKICNKHFVKSQSLAGHVKSAHPGNRHPKTQICEACGKSFSKKSGLRNHKCGFNDSAKIEEGKRCDICSKMIALSSFKAHRQYHLGGKKACNLCKKVFANKSSLERHKLIHFNIKAHQCDVCFQGFSQKTALNTHKRVHTGERSSCTSCGKKFISKSLLNHHYKVTKCSKPND